jgi:hypothetical protein
MLIAVADNGVPTGKEPPFKPDEPGPEPHGVFLKPLPSGDDDWQPGSG